jgi:hypothetical protein
MLPDVVLVALVLGGFASFTFFQITYRKFGQINERSIRLIDSLKSNLRTFNPEDRKLVAKYLISYRPLRIELGSIGHYRKTNMLRVFGRIIFYTSKLLVATKRL